MSDEPILLPNVAMSDATDAEQQVVAIAKQNMAVVDEAIGDENSVTSNQPIGEQNGALS